MICKDVRVHESHYAGCAIIIFCYFFRSTQTRVKIFMSFQVGDVSCTCKRSERAKRAHSLYVQYKYKVVDYKLQVTSQCNDPIPTTCLGLTTLYRLNG